jgi:hypothetical protein
MFNLNSLPSPNMTDSVFVNPVLSEPSVSDSQPSVKESKPSANFFTDLLLLFKVAFSSIDDV